jgi:hypothetical protein
VPPPGQERGERNSEDSDVRERDLGPFAAERHFDRRLEVDVQEQHGQRKREHDRSG